MKKTNVVTIFCMVVLLFSEKAFCSLAARTALRTIRTASQYHAVLARQVAANTTSKYRATRTLPVATIVCGNRSLINHSMQRRNYSDLALLTDIVQSEVADSKNDTFTKWVGTFHRLSFEEIRELQDVVQARKIAIESRKELHDYRTMESCKKLDRQLAVIKLAEIEKSKQNGYFSDPAPGYLQQERAKISDIQKIIDERLKRFIAVSTELYREDRPGIPWRCLFHVEIDKPTIGIDDVYEAVKKVLDDKGIKKAYCTNVDGSQIGFERTSSLFGKEKLVRLPL